MLTRIKRHTFNMGAIALVLGASSAIAAPSMAQTASGATTSIPITGGSFTVNVTNAATNNVTSSKVTVLTPVGTAQVTSLSGTTAGTTNLAVGNAFDIVGKSTGSVKFDTGTSANFTDANTTIKGKVVTTSKTGNVSALTAAAEVEGAIQKDSSIEVLSSSISAVPENTKVIPITGGSFDVIKFVGNPVENIKTTVLTPFGTANFKTFSYATLDNLNGASVFKTGDDLRGTAKASGTVAVGNNQISEFSNADVAVLGTVKTVNDLGGASTGLKGDVTGGNLSVPTSSITTLPPTSNLGSIVLIVANPKLLNLVKKEPKFADLSKFKYLTVLVTNTQLLTYSETKTTSVSNAQPVSIGTSNAIDSVVFISFKKISLFPIASEVSFKRPIILVGKIPPGQAKKQRVVFVGMGSRIMPGFGVIPRVESGGDDDDDDDD